MAAGNFSTFYEYFLFTKTWAYGLMFLTLPAFVAYWNFFLYPDKKRFSLKNDDDECSCTETDKH